MIPSVLNNKKNDINKVFSKRIVLMSQSMEYIISLQKMARSAWPAFGLCFVITFISEMNPAHISVCLSHVCCLHTLNQTLGEMLWKTKMSKNHQ